MRTFLIAQLIGLLFISGMSAGTEHCLYFPLAKGMTWTYVNFVFPETLVAEVTDTVTVNKNLYYIYAPYGADENGIWSRYHLRPETDKIYALNMQDTTEYLLFDFSAEKDTWWIVPPDSGNPPNQCDWGSRTTSYRDRDSIRATERVFYHIRQFSHSDKPCADAGIDATVFARDFGPVKMSFVTIAGIIDHELVTTADTIRLAGKYVLTGNPCLTVPCPPGIVSAVRSAGTNYFLTHREGMYWEGNFSWYEYTPLSGDSVLLIGIPTRRIDVNGNIFQTIEVLGFEKIDPNLLPPDKGMMQPGRFYLEQNYPNPFNPETLIRYEIPSDVNVSLRIIGPAGHTISVLINAWQKQGRHEVRFDARNLASGVYFCVLQAGNQQATQKMVMIK